MKFHFLFYEKQTDVFSKGENIYAPTLVDAILKFNEEYPEVILLAIFTNNFKK